MTNPHPLSGVYAAALTPIHPDFSPSPEEQFTLLAFLAGRGCHGALLLGTTGEGPSFSPPERLALMRAGAEARQSLPGFRLLTGTGTPSLDETITLTRQAFDLGMDGVVVLPPYYYRNASEDGLFAWFREVIQKAVPSDGAFLGYHIPAVSGVPLSLDLLARLKEAFPRQFVGLKDSSGDPENARQLGKRFGGDLLVLSGSDKLLSLALENQAGGCITALANLFSPFLRQIWDSYHEASTEKAVGAPDMQSRMTAIRTVTDRYAPAPPLLKALIARLHGLPRWTVRPPLLPLGAAREEQCLAELASLLE